VIKPEKMNGALYALHIIMVQGRWMAYQNEDAKKIAKLMDWGEILPMLMLSKEDETDRFRLYLQGVVDDFPLCRLGLDAFDEGVSAEWWK
jgi:hypothetical protein